MKAWRLGSYELQVTWPEIHHRSTPEREEVWISFATTLRWSASRGRWLIGVRLLGFGAGIRKETFVS